MAVRIAVLFLVFGLFSAGYAEMQMPNWVFYAGSEFGSYYYNPESVGYLSNNLVRIAHNLVLTEKGRINLAGELGKEYENVSEILALTEMDCVRKKSRILEIAYCSEGGSVLKSESYRPLDWDSILPDSTEDVLHGAVCNRLNHGLWVDAGTVPISRRDLCRAR